ncbi:MAG: NAD(P)H-dependent oxidoreductase [Puniceicoccaceae bacterium]
MAAPLLQFVHPALEKSRVNRRLLERAKGLEAVTVNDLYESYPDFCIDAAHEQSLMEAHESIVFQFPLYWYSSPALLKEWFDIVLQYGWAYGSTGTALVGKTARLAVTTGAPAESYSREGHNGFTMEELLRPIQCTLELCGMEVGKPFFAHGAMHLDQSEMERITQTYEIWLLED